MSDSVVLEMASTKGVLKASWSSLRMETAGFSSSMTLFKRAEETVGLWGILNERVSQSKVTDVVPVLMVEFDIYSSRINELTSHHTLSLNTLTVPLDDR
jgi:hypothetical protein